MERMDDEKTKRGVGELRGLSVYLLIGSERCEEGGDRVFFLIKIAPPLSPPTPRRQPPTRHSHRTGPLGLTAHAHVPGYEPCHQVSAPLTPDA